MQRSLKSINPFVRLNALLKDVPPGRSPLPGGEPADMGIGDPRTGMPAMAAETVAAEAPGWSRYPPFQGHPDLVAAIADWLTRRYGLTGGFMAAHGRVLPTSGSREGIFFLVTAAVARKKRQGEPRPAVLLPDPGYHVYAGAAMASGAETVFVPVGPEGRHLPDFGMLPEEVLKRAAVAFLCSPANPQGSAATAEQITAALGLARRHGFLLMADECYGDLYSGEASPVGALTVAEELGEGLQGLVAAHSLSKRSGAPGLRCGFLSGEPEILDDVEGLLRFGGSSVPMPVQRAAITLLNDEEHVAASRAYYRRAFAVAEAAFGPGFAWTPPDGGFFAWLDVTGSRAGDGETAARMLWQAAGLRTLPGAYMSLAERPPEENPGRPYLRIALVERPETLEPLVARVAEVLL